MPVIAFPPSLPRHAERLAGVTPRDHIDGGQVVGLDLVDIPEHGHVRPVAPQHLLTVRVVLDEPRGPEPSRGLKAEVEATDTAEARADTHHQKVRGISPPLGIYRPLLGAAAATLRCSFRGLQAHP
jgi:hypothetical protein